MEPTVEHPAVAPPDESPPRARRPAWTTVVIGLVALAVGLGAGVAIGWKVEQNRVRNDIKNIRPVATVVDVTDDTLTVHLRTGRGERTYRLTDATVIDKAEPGTTGDIAAGSTVFIRTRRGSDGAVEAAQVVVLPEELPSGDQ